VQERGPEVIGVDISQRMAERAARRLTGAVVADMRSLPFRDRAVSGVVAFYSFIHLPRGELAVAFAELVRILVPGGRVFVSAHEGVGDVEVHDFLDHEVDLCASLFRLDELEEAAAVAGLTTVARERRPPYENEGSTVRLFIDAVKQEE
jgi:ubiquinone/menaquinone biosynthesis C-methylase UbiE